MNKMFSCRALFFDAGGTLFRPNPSVGEIYARVASRYGNNHAPEVLEQRFHQRWQQRGGLASIGGPSTPETEKRWWRSLVGDVFTEIASGPSFEDFFEELYRIFGEAESWRLYPEVADTLKELKAKGFRMGIISNWDSRLLSLCKAMGLESYFDFILISAVLGYSKPGKKIFQDALDRVPCKAGEAVFVGDSYADDYQGALDAGWGAIYLNRHGECSKDIVCINNLGELAACIQPL